MIDLNEITVRIGAKTLLDQASAHISDGQKVGLVGANGCGKSTLFRVLKGELETETGSVFFPADSRVVFVEQEMQNIETPILDYVLAQDWERAQLLESLNDASENELGEIHERLRLIEADSAPARASAVLVGLGFKNEDFGRPIREFSGGWRMRLALAAALFRPSDILLLDEPTNHLDLEAGLWLENHLRKYRGTLVLISHDRNILNSVCDYIINFDHGKLVTYSGNYDTFRKTRALQQEVNRRRFEKQEQQRKHLQSFVDRFRYKASKAKQAQSRIKMLEKMETIELVEDDPTTVFDFPAVEELPPPLLNIEDGEVGYDGRAVLKRLNIQLNPDDRIALLGANGNGKSTLAKLLSGRLPLMKGKEHRLSKLKIGYFAQHQAEELPLNLTAAEYMAGLLPPQTPESKVRSHLARFGLTQEKSITLIERLSGGEKARLLFAAMTRNAPEVLILDEPTNHLDIDGREALIRALNDYRGAVILITHDIHLVELIADDLWLVHNGTCKKYAGDLNDYRQLLLGMPQQTAPAPKKAVTEVSAAAVRSEKKELASRQRRLEKSLDELNRRKADLEARFLTPLSPAEMVEIQKELAWLSGDLQKAEDEWLEVSGRLETIQ